jgi:3-methylcrotonyl-CoA carboxylase alpha subunit
MKMIRKLLIANRGEIARRVARTARAEGIATVAVFSDADAGAAHVAEADEAVRLGPAASAESYLRVDAVLEAARRTGADAVHPGYGFLSENADFAEAVIAAGLTWVGPPPAAMRALGAKAPARQVAAALDIPTVPGYDGDDDGADRLIAEAARIGAPVLIKASGGGGGRGMRRVDDLADLPAAIASARREAVASFSDARLLLERCVERPRHIEVQILADAHGHVVHLFERECSIQRRHQKIVEEAPSPAVSPALREALGDAACRLARHVGYVGAGTVEFLVAGEGAEQAFYFLELNARLQVEHPVTELICGVDLVGLQLAIAEGKPLPFTQADLAPRGHAIEVRLCAEDPLRDFLPGTGRVLAWDVGGDGVRVDAAVRAGDEVSPHYDSMLAKIIAWGPDRGAARRRLARALDHAWVPGVVHNLPLLRDILSDAAFAEGDLDTSFLARRGLPRPPPEHPALAATLAAALAWRARSTGEVPAGWRLSGPAEDVDRWATGAVEMVVRAQQRGSALAVRVDDGPVAIAQVDGDRVTVEGHTRRVRSVTDGASATPTDGDTLYLHFGDGEAMLRLVPRFAPPAGAGDDPGTLSAPTPGVVRAVRVAAGDVVQAGEALVVLESMKVEHTLRAPSGGVVRAVLVDVGEAVAGGAVLVRLEADGGP